MVPIHYYAPVLKYDRARLVRCKEESKRIQLVKWDYSSLHKEMISLEPSSSDCRVRTRIPIGFQVVPSNTRWSFMPLPPHRSSYESILNNAMLSPICNWEQLSFWKKPAEHQRVPASWWSWTARSSLHCCHLSPYEGQAVFRYVASFFPPLNKHHCTK